MIKIDWKKELKKITAQLTKGSDSFKKEITPYRDWRIVVVIFMIGLVSLLGFNVYISVGISNDKFIASSQATDESLKFNDKGLDKILKGITDKKEAFEKARTETGSLVDPSL